MANSDKYILKHVKNSFNTMLDEIKNMEDDGGMRAVANFWINVLKASTNSMVDLFKMCRGTETFLPNHYAQYFQMAMAKSQCVLLNKDGPDGQNTGNVDDRRKKKERSLIANGQAEIGPNVLAKDSQLSGDGRLTKKELIKTTAATKSAPKEVAAAKIDLRINKPTSGKLESSFSSSTMHESVPPLTIIIPEAALTRTVVTNGNKVSDLDWGPHQNPNQKEMSSQAIEDAVLKRQCNSSLKQVGKGLRMYDLFKGMCGGVTLENESENKLKAAAELFYKNVCGGVTSSEDSSNSDADPEPSETVLKAKPKVSATVKRLNEKGAKRSIPKKPSKGNMHTSTKHQVLSKPLLHKNKRTAAQLVDPGPFVCAKPWCNKAFGLKQNRNRHSETCGLPISFTCEVCKKTFSTKGNLKTHQKAHEGGWQCKYCATTLNNAMAYSRHMKKCGSYSCNKCGVRFAQEEDLQIHCSEC